MAGILPIYGVKLKSINQSTNQSINHNKKVPIYNVECRMIIKLSFERSYDYVR